LRGITAAEEEKIEEAEEEDTDAFRRYVRTRVAALEGLNGGEEAEATSDSDPKSELRMLRRLLHILCCPVAAPILRANGDLLALLVSRDPISAAVEAWLRQTCAAAFDDVRRHFTKNLVLADVLTQYSAIFDVHKTRAIARDALLATVPWLQPVTATVVAAAAPRITFPFPSQLAWAAFAAHRKLILQACGTIDGVHHQQQSLPPPPPQQPPELPPFVFARDVCGMNVKPQKKPNRSPQSDFTHLRNMAP
jgi:hypothetical protein